MLSGMLSLLLMLRRLVAAARTAWGDKAFRGVVFSLVTLLIIATIFYTITEGWSVLDSLYFSVVTGLTIGYGDFAPQEPISKVFTMVYALLAVGLFVALVASLANASVSRRQHKRKPGSPDGRDTGDGG
jgi:voltage-gated potassium channel